MTILVGVDAGASHTEAVVADETLCPLGRQTGPAGAVGPGRVTAAAEVIAAVVSAALEGARREGAPHAAVVGAAGAGHTEVQEALGRALLAVWGGTRIAVVTDGEVALEAAFPDGAGILLTAGTGSIAYARDPAGALRRVGGLGWRFGDEGSGYALAKAALRAVSRAADRRGPHTELSHRLQGATGTDSFSGLSQWMKTAGHSAVAGLARRVCDAATAGDQVAAELVMQAALDLADHVAGLLPAFAGSRTVPLALAGGLLQLGSPVRETLLEILRSDMPMVALRDEPVDPPMGAVRMAARLLV
jgi:N-acetylglucosamine kinase-like BadF-type ATPase